MIKKYKVVAKVDNDKFVTYHVNNLIKFSQFLDLNFSGWRWFNVYDKSTEKQVGSYTNKDRPSNAKEFENGETNRLKK
jgi:ABC-type uncharacterized transport system permease subunit